ncbi:polysaccharide lyase [Microbulbifer sp. JMSA002]|uniref:polysaccharide lyase n=1 Tax=Microbulbifer sp. JMSA002 TaxID=3243368 RepID=UPI004039BAE4
MKKLFTFLTIVTVLMVSNISIASEYTDHALFRMNFEYNSPLKIKSNHLKVITFPTIGPNRLLEASYVPYSEGSERITGRLPLTDSVSSATLSYDVKFHSDFQFVRGGKLHGLGGGTGTTGCKPIDPKGWSVRVMFDGEGSPKLYVYHQDRQRACGDSFANLTDFKFDLHRWYRVELFVQMNTAANNADGFAELYVDGNKISEKHGLRLTGSMNALVDTFLFSTFHGGSTKEWAPTKTVKAYFDNFTVKNGKRIAGKDAWRCEYKEGGIYTTNGACCKNSCGSCGGTGCGALPGGASACCSLKVVNEAPLCSYPATNAPCSL